MPPESGAGGDRLQLDRQYLAKAFVARRKGVAGLASAMRKLLKEISA